MAPKIISAKYDSSTLTVDFARDDGRHLLRTGGTVAWRFNNPGNLRPGRAGVPIMGAIAVGTTKGNGKFLIYASYDEGRAQKRSLLRRKYNSRTIYTMLAGIPDGQGNIIEGYAPASDKNNPVAYANFISSKTGFPTTTVLSTLTDEQLHAVMDAMEAQEGFHGMKSTRQEQWIDTTGITVSDGANPKPQLTVGVKIGEKIYHQKTDERGQLPKVAHTSLGQQVEIHLPDITGALKKQFQFVMGPLSASYVVFHELLGFSAVTGAKKASPSPAPPQKTPVRYVVQSGDTVPKIAKRFKCSVSSILEYNPAIKNVNTIYAGQVLGIYGSIQQAQPRRPSAMATNATQVPVTRSKEGKGQPIAIVQIDQRQAPWMVKAIEEAKRWAGTDETVITKTRNYHHELGQGGNLESTPWCASFINFCLKSTATPYEHSASSQFPCSSKKFVKISKPVFGAIMVMRDYDRETGAYVGLGHVTFVYGRADGNAIVGLGGNQGNTIRASRYQTSGASSKFNLHGKKLEQRFYAFYIPATYVEYAKQESELQVVDPDKVNKDLLGFKRSATSLNEGTR